MKKTPMPTLEDARLFESNYKLFDYSDKSGSITANISADPIFHSKKVSEFQIELTISMSGEVESDDGEKIKTFEGKCVHRGFFKFKDGKKVEVESFADETALTNFAQQIYLISRNYTIETLIEMGIRPSQVPYHLPINFEKKS